MRLNTLHKLAFGLGAIGWVVGDRLLMTYALYFYVPPDGVGLVEKLPLFIFPVWGLVSLVGRGIDTFVDPVCASLTDRSTHPMGRRRFFMLLGALPLAGGAAAVFFPPFPGASWANAAWAAFWLTFYFSSFSLYVCPFQALLPDLARTEKERLDLSTIQAIAMLVGAAAVMIGSPAMLGALSDVAPEPRYQITVVAFCAVAFLLTLAPVLFIPERQLVQEAKPSTLSVVEAIKATLRAPGVKLYLVGNVAFWFGFNTVASGVPYFVTTLMKREESFAGVVLAATFGVAGACFPLVNWLAKRITKRRVMILGGASLAALMLAVPLIQGPTSGVLVMALGGFPIAVLMTVPNAILADIATSEAQRTGENREAMFFGAQGFFQKINLGISTLILAALLTLGKSAEQPLGVQLIGPATAGILLLTVVCFWRFREPAA